MIATEIAAEYPLVMFRVFSKQTGERTVLCMRDSHRWTFRGEGVPLPFEEVEAYTRRSVSRRLTRTIALDYVKAMGWDAASASFWEASGAATYLDKVTLH